jgi:hypothetical protein
MLRRLAGDTVSASDAILDLARRMRMHGVGAWPNELHAIAEDVRRLELALDYIAEDAREQMAIALDAEKAKREAISDGLVVVGKWGRM